MGPTALLPLRRKACWGFFRPKNPTASAGFEPANLGTKGQHATPRPPKPLNYSFRRTNFVLHVRHFGEMKITYGSHSNYECCQQICWCYRLNTKSLFVPSNLMALYTISSLSQSCILNMSSTGCFFTGQVANSPFQKNKITSAAF